LSFFSFAKVWEFLNIRILFSEGKFFRAFLPQGGGNLFPVHNEKEVEFSPNLPADPAED